MRSSDLHCSKSEEDCWRRTRTALNQEGTRVQNQNIRCISIMFRLSGGILLSKHPWQGNTLLTKNPRTIEAKTAKVTSRYKEIFQTYSNKS